MTKTTIDLNALEFVEGSPPGIFITDAYGCQVRRQPLENRLVITAGNKCASVALPSQTTIDFVCGPCELPKPPVADEIVFADSVCKIRMPSSQLCKEVLLQGICKQKFIVNNDFTISATECGGWMVVNRDSEIDDVAVGVFIMDDVLYAPPYYYPEISNARCHKGVIYDQVTGMIVAWDKKRHPLYPAPVIVTRNTTEPHCALSVLPPELVGIIELYLPGDRVITPHPMQEICDTKYVDALFKYYGICGAYDVYTSCNMSVMIKRDLEDTYFEIDDSATCITYVNDIHAKTTDVVIDGMSPGGVGPAAPRPCADGKVGPAAPRPCADGTLYTLGWGTPQVIRISPFIGFHEIPGVGLCFATVPGTAYIVGCPHHPLRVYMQNITSKYATCMSRSEKGTYIHAIRFSDMKAICQRSVASFEITSVEVVGEADA
jgi:hypothetical protein